MKQTAGPRHLDRAFMSLPQQTTRPEPMIHWRLALLLLGVTLVVHHPVLWIDHILWDEVSFEKMAQTGDLSGKLFSTLHQSIPTVYPFYALFAWLPEPTLAMRVGALLSLWITAMAVTSILLDFAGARRETALAAGLLTLTYPAYQVYANAGAAIYAACVAMFALAIWCGLIGLRAPSRRSGVWFVSSAGCLTASFAMQSLLVYFYAAIAAIALVGWRHRNAILPNLPVPERWQRGRAIALLLLVPPANYYLLRHFFPLHPYFGSTAAGYNVPHFDLSVLARVFLDSLSTTLITPLSRLRTMPVGMWMVAAVLTIGLLSNRRLREWLGMSPGNATPGNNGLPLLVAGAGLLLLGLFPYIAVGKPPTTEGVQTRFAILVAPSLAVVLCGLLELLKTPMARQWGLAACIVVFTGFATQHARAYADWQICAIKDHACVAALRRITPPQDVGMFLIKGENLEHTYRREFYDWGRIFHEAWGGYDRIGVPESRFKPPHFHYQTPMGINRDQVANFAHWMGYGNPNAPDEMAEVVFESSRDLDITDGQIWPTVLRDLACRLGLGSESREAWLAHFITGVKITAPRAYAYDSGRLSVQPLLRSNPPQWQDTLTRPLIAGMPGSGQIAVESQKAGSFSILLAGGQGFLLRCDRMENGQDQEAELDIKIDVGPMPANPKAKTWGVALKIPRADNITPPRLVLVLADGTEIEGAWRSDNNDSLEVWTTPDNTSAPERAWVVWRINAAGSRMYCASIGVGWLNLE